MPPVEMATAPSKVNSTALKWWKEHEVACNFNLQQINSAEKMEVC
jgi:hypothetical protein